MTTPLPRPKLDYICSWCHLPCETILRQRNPYVTEHRSACCRAPLIVRTGGG